MKVKHKTYLIVEDPSRSFMDDPVKVNGNPMIGKAIKRKVKSRSLGAPLGM